MTLPAELPTLAELLDGSRVYSVKLRQPFRGLSSRQGLLLEGPSGWGEFAPFDDYSDLAAARWLASGVEAAWGSWPDPVRSAVPVNAIIPAVSAVDASDLVRQSGCATVKVKVAQAGQSLADDVARVAAVREALGPDGRIRIDANGAWSVAAAKTALVELSDFALEYAEQPCETLAEMRDLRRIVNIPLAVDEGIRRAPDPKEVAGVCEACDILVLKAAPLGGVGAAHEIAGHYGLPVVVSSALESSIGLSAGLALAASLPDLQYACGLDTGRLFANDVVRVPLVPTAGMLSVSRPVLDENASLAVEGSAALLSRWRERASTAYAALTALAPDSFVRPAGGRQ